MLELLNSLQKDILLLLVEVEDLPMKDGLPEYKCTGITPHLILRTGQILLGV